MKLHHPNVVDVQKRSNKKWFVSTKTRWSNACVVINFNVIKFTKKKDYIATGGLYAYSQHFIRQKWKLMTLKQIFVLLIKCRDLWRGAGLCFWYCNNKYWFPKAQRSFPSGAFVWLESSENIKKNIGWRIYKSFEYNFANTDDQYGN